jgi:hypothetical protein
MRNITMDLSSGCEPTEPQKQIIPVDNATVPYWRTELHALDEHRTTEELPKECDIAIVGAGMTGIATAYHISKLAGDDIPSVVILEARQLCSGATGRNGVGESTPAMRWHCPNPTNRVIARYKQRPCKVSPAVSARKQPRKC